MINYNKLITLALKEGKSLEDIAKDFADALNVVAAEKDPREEYLNDLDDIFTDMLECEEVDIDSGIACIVLAVADEHPDWDVETLQAFEESIKSTIDASTRMTDCYVNKGNISEVVFDLIREAVVDSKNKSANDCGCQSCRSDDEKLSAFFKGLGL